MKRFAMTLILTVATSAILLAQAPEGISYQAIARDGSGLALINQSVDVRFSVREGNPLGTVVYEETHNTATNDFGLITLLVGQGNANIGTFNNIDWGNNSFYLQVEMDAGKGYVDLGTTQMMSVPYALYAKEAGNAGKDYNAGSGIDINGTTISNTGDLDGSDDMLKDDAAGGDLSGTYPNPTVSKLQGKAVSAQSPNVGDVLVWNGSEWVPDTLSGQGGGSSLWSKNGNDVYYNQGMVGINNPTPDQTLDVEGTFQLSNTGTSYNQSTNNSDESYSLTIDGDTIHSFYVNKRRYATLFGDNAPVTGLSAFDVNTHTGINSYGGMYINHESTTGKPFYGYATDGEAKAWSYYDGASGKWHLHNDSDQMTVTNDGRIGIGTTTPYARKLHILNSDSYASDRIVEIESTDSAFWDLVRLRAPSNSTGDFIKMLTTPSNLIKASISTSGEAYFGSVKLYETTSTPEIRTLYANALPAAYALVQSSGLIPNGSNYGVVSAIKNSTGTYTLTLQNKWRYAPIVSITCQDVSGGEIANYSYYTASNTIVVKIMNSNGTLVDSNFSILVFGDTKSN